MAGEMDAIYQEIAATLRALRAQHDYTQEYMAHRLGISQNAYSKLERGKTRIDINHIYKLAEVYDVPVTGFLPKPATSTGINTAGLPQLLRKVRDLFSKALNRR